MACRGGLSQESMMTVTKSSVISPLLFSSQSGFFFCVILQEKTLTLSLKLETIKYSLCKSIQLMALSPTLMALWHCRCAHRKIQPSILPLITQVSSTTDRQVMDVLGQILNMPLVTQMLSVDQSNLEYQTPSAAALTRQLLPQLTPFRVGQKDPNRLCARSLVVRRSQQQTMLAVCVVSVQKMYLEERPIELKLIDADGILTQTFLYKNYKSHTMRRPPIKPTAQSLPLTSKAMILSSCMRAF